jgi:hypothetical protein
MQICLAGIVEIIQKRFIIREDRVPVKLPGDRESQDSLDVISSAM